MCSASVCCGPKSLSESAGDSPSVGHSPARSLQNRITGGKYAQIQFQ